jgi:hypothetical protein
VRVLPHTTHLTPPSHPPSPLRQEVLPDAGLHALWREVVTTPLEEDYGGPVEQLGAIHTGELKQLGAFKELLDGFSEAELDNPDLVDGAARERIAKQVCVCEGSAANPILSILLLSFNLLILRYCLLTSSYTSIPLFLYSSIPLYLYI